jgi:hypothetical protein
MLKSREESCPSSPADLLMTPNNTRPPSTQAPRLEHCFPPRSHHSFVQDHSRHLQQHSARFCLADSSRCLLAMSAPTPGAPGEATYQIDPDRQCGVVKSDGNPCSVRLSCRVHSAVEKNAVKRSAEFKKLLKGQPESRALDTRILTAPANSLRFAPVFDPDIHCGVRLRNPEPCTQPMIACKPHFFAQLAQQSSILGRSASLDGLRRVHQANSDPKVFSTSGDKLPFDPDTQCGVAKGEKKCQKALSRCTRHTLKDKRNVPRRPPFENQFDLLVRLQVSGASTLEIQPLASVFDSDICCGVIVSNTVVRERLSGGRCLNSLSCTVHQLSQKRVVQRSTNFDTLFKRQSATSEARDTQCYVALPGGGTCPNGLDCNLHTFAEKNMVPRRKGIHGLKVEQKEAASSYNKMTFGFSSALVDVQDIDPPFASVVRRYRRTGMQSLSATDESVHGDCHEYSVYDTKSDNLNRLRQFLFEPIPETPTRSVDHLLSQDKCRTLSAQQAKLYENDADFGFAFSTKPYVLGLTFSHTEALASKKKLLHSCFFKVSKSDFGMSATKAKIILDKMRPLLERSPVDLHLMSDKLLDWFFHNAMLAASVDATIDDPVRIPFHFELAVIGSEPSVILDIKIMGLHTDEAQQTLHRMPIAIPLRSEVEEVSPPKSAGHELFEFRGLEVGQSWLNTSLSPHRQQLIRDLACYIVATTHLVPMGRKNLNYLIGSEIGPMFNVALLMRLSDKPDFYNSIASYNPDTGLVSAPPFLGFPDIYTQKHGLCGDLVVQCAKSRYLQTKDFLIAWSDASNAADMHQKYPDDLVDLNCWCSEEESLSATHMCLICRRLVVCHVLVKLEVAGRELRACPTCNADGQSTDDRQRKSRKDLTQEDEAKSDERGSKDHKRKRKSRKGVTQEDEVKRDERGRKDRERKGKYHEPGHTTVPGMQAKLRRAIRKRSRSEHKLLGFVGTRRSTDTQAAYQVTNRVREAPSPDLWHCDDGYFVTPITCSHENGVMKCSIEACQPIVLQDGIARIHTAPNLTITRLYANGLCGPHSSIVLRVFHDLDASTSPSEQQKLVERMDNLHLIRLQIPLLKKSRLAMPFEPGFAKQLSIQHETGVATLEGCRRLAGRSDIWRISARFTLSPDSVSKTAYEDLPAIDAVAQFVTDLESTSERKLRRMNGVPYPFHGGPKLPHWSWPMFYQLMQYRLTRLKRDCNKRHITAFGVPELICVVLYLLHNGRSAQPSQLLDVPVCIFDKHPLCMSIGKANHKAGMTAGFSTQLPLSFETFKADEVNLCVEPWLCNASKSNRDDQVDTIRRDFRDNLKIANLPYWPAELAPLDEGVRERYIQNASAIIGELEDEISDEDVPREFDEDGDESDDEESDDDDSDDGDEDEGENENKIGHDASKKTGTGDPGSGNASGGGDSNTSSTLTIVPGKRNMSNLAATCYMSTVLQVLHNNEGIRRYVMDPENFIFKVQTGVSDDEFLKADLSTRNAQEISDSREARLAAMQPLVFGLRQLFQELDSGGDRLKSTDTQDILDSVQLIDDRWENKPNESAELMNTILTTLITASDRSDLSARGAYAYAAETRNSLAPEPILEDADNALRLYRAEGRDTKLSELLHTQYVSEIPCANCPSVSRSFEHTFVKYLALPDAQPGQTFTLEDLLSQFYIEYLTHGLPCKVDGTHTPSFMNHRRVSFGAEYICFAIQRGHNGRMELLNQVAFPEQIDLGRIMDMQHLPSNTHTHQPRKQIVPIKKSPYELVAVNNWVSRHYIAYVRDPTDGSWIMFNDLQSHPKKKSPMDGWREGEIVHYGVYKRHSAPDTEPRVSSMVHEENAQDQISTGVSGTNDDDATMHQHGDDGMVTQQHGDGGTPATPARPAHGHSNVASPSYTSPLSPNARKNRRQLSSDISAGKQITSKTSRGSLHGDISAAKHGEALKARENDLKTQEAQLRSAEAQNDRREAQLRDQQAEQDRRAQVLQDAELEVTRLRERAQRADELEHILGGLREQRTSMLQSIEDLRANLVTRQTSYQNELMFISTQSNAVEAQIKELQQSMEEFRVQRDDATARYQQDKAEMEAQINRLQEEIIALFN